jgi:hypothetical protein
VVLDSLGGYRLLRTIGVGSRAEVLLAHPVRPDADLAPVVVKVYGASVSDESIMAEVEALSRAAGEHVVRLIDVTATPEGAPALILSRHAAGSLARLLADRGALRAGEAITVLAPVAVALARMHSAGVAHGAIGPGAVLFDAAGAPALACFGRAALFPPGLPAAGLEAEQAVLADVLAFGALAAGILEGAGATALAHRARTEAAPGAWLLDFADALFDLAEPAPVDLRPRDEPGAEWPARLPARVISAPVEAPSGVAPAGAARERPPYPEPRAPAWRVAVRRAREALVRVRRSFWVVAGASVVALVVTVVVVPQGRTTAPAPPSASPTARAVEQSASPVTADDPVEAAALLMRTREQCIRDLSAECLDNVDQRDSAALDADREVVRSMLKGGAPPSLPVVDPEHVRLVQRLGDSALVSLGPDSEPASVLLVKGEAGWRIRDYLAG